MGQDRHQLVSNLVFLLYVGVLGGARGRVDWSPDNHAFHEAGAKLAVVVRATVAYRIFTHASTTGRVCKPLRLSTVGVVQRTWHACNGRQPFVPVRWRPYAEQIPTFTQWRVEPKAHRSPSNIREIGCSVASYDRRTTICCSCRKPLSLTCECDVPHGLGSVWVWPCGRDTDPIGCHAAVAATTMPHAALQHLWCCPTVASSPTSSPAADH